MRKIAQSEQVRLINVQGLVRRAMKQVKASECKNHLLTSIAGKFADFSCDDTQQLEEAVNAVLDQLPYYQARLNKQDCEAMIAQVEALLPRHRPAITNIKAADRKLLISTIVAIHVVRTIERAVIAQIRTRSEPEIGFMPIEHVDHSAPALIYDPPSEFTPLPEANIHSLAPTTIESQTARALPRASHRQRAAAILGVAALASVIVYKQGRSRETSPRATAHTISSAPISSLSPRPEHVPQPEQAPLLTTTLPITPSAEETTLTSEGRLQDPMSPGRALFEIALRQALTPLQDKVTACWNNHVIPNPISWLTRRITIRLHEANWHVGNPFTPAGITLEWHPNNCQRITVTHWHQASGTNRQTVNRLQLDLSRN